MKEKRLLYLSRADVAASGVKIQEIITALEEAFREKGEGRVEMPPKPGVHSRPDAFIHAMPAYIPAMKSIGVKWVSGYPENPKRGLPYINGLLILNDPDNGLPLSVMDCIWITARRTGAATALAARYLARPESRTLGVLGAGVQGFTNLEALRTVFPIEKVVIYDTVLEQMDRYRQKVGDHWPEIEVARAAEPRRAVEGLDLVVTAGPIFRKPHATIKAGWLSRGAFASLVDLDSYWHKDAMKEADKFVTDDIPQLEHFQDIGYLQDIPPIYADLGALVTGKKPGREQDGERTMTCNIGLAIDDMAAATLVYRRAVEKKLGTWLPL